MKYSGIDKDGVDRTHFWVFSHIFVLLQATFRVIHLYSLARIDRWTSDNNKNWISLRT